jgi:hypothetical protein
MAQANHTRTEKNNQQFPPIISRKTLDSSRYGGGIKQLIALESEARGLANEIRKATDKRGHVAVLTSNTES